VALDRACWLSERGYLAGEQERWKEYAQRLREKILRYGFNSEINAFTRGYRETDLDASNLLIPLMEFLPPEDPRVQGTIDATLERLTVNDLVYRYRYRDGLPGEEGAFVLCTFWLVDALALSNRLDEAERIFENLVNRSNHLGLLAEQIDPYSGELLGNFPQAYSHLGLINSSLYLAARKGREIPVGPLLGMTNGSS
jgi:GH15 family glucan-1,4-alpha-glucosidase